jgi:hypothetical protein
VPISDSRYIGVGDDLPLKSENHTGDRQQKNDKSCCDSNTQVKPKKGFAKILHKPFPFRVMFALATKSCKNSYKDRSLFWARLKPFPETFWQLSMESCWWLC